MAVLALLWEWVSAVASSKVGGGVDVCGSRSGLPPIAPTASTQNLL